jgi:hypothetical protein
VREGAFMGNIFDEWGEFSVFSGQFSENKVAASPRHFLITDNRELKTIVSGANNCEK